MIRVKLVTEMMIAGAKVKTVSSPMTLRLSTRLPSPPPTLMLISGSAIVGAST